MTSRLSSKLKVLRLPLSNYRLIIIPIFRIKKASFREEWRFFYIDHDYAVAIDMLNSDTATKAAKKKVQKYLDNIQVQYGFSEAVE